MTGSFFFQFDTIYVYSPPHFDQPKLSFVLIITTQKMKPDWDKLMDAFADSDSALVGDVDCTAEGKDLCTQQGVKGYVSKFSW
jgi:hypothetical protein